MNKYAKVGGMTVTGKTEVLSRCRMVHHKFNKDWPGIEPKIPGD